MTLKKVYICGGCGAERKEANHWFVLERTKAGFHLHTWKWAEREQVLDDDRMEHVCGQACAHTMLDRFMTEAAGE